MIDRIHNFIFELLRAANDVGPLTSRERVRLLQRASVTIRVLRDEIKYSESPVNDSGSPKDIVYYLNEAANLVDQFSDAEMEETIVEAIGVIQAAQILLEEKWKIEGANRAAGGS